jgi:single-strand DNA-binding protein
MPSYIKIFVIGHLGKDPELRYTPDGTAVASFTMAANERKKVDGNYQDFPIWFKVTAWRKLAENCTQNLQKGSLCMVEGRLGMENWTTREGKEVQQMAIQADNVQFLGDKPQNARPRNEPTSRPNASTPPPAVPNTPLSDDDIPF